MRSLKTLFLSLFLLAAPVFAQNPTQQNSVGDITATAASCTLVNTTGCVVLPLPNNNRTGVAITVTGTWTGTLNFIGTNSTLPFSSAVAVSPLAGGAAVTTTSGNGTWFAPILGLGVFGVDASAMSGTATVTITSSTGGSTGGGGTTGSITCTVPGGVAYENGIANALTCGSDFVRADAGQVALTADESNDGPALTLTDTVSNTRGVLVEANGSFNISGEGSDTNSAYITLGDDFAPQASNTSIYSERWTYFGTNGNTSWFGAFGMDPMTLVGQIRAGWIPDKVGQVPRTGFFSAVDAVGANEVIIQELGTIGSNYNFNLPTTAGSAGQVLTSQGGLTSPMTWTTVSASPSFSAITSGTNTAAAMVLGSGSSLTTSGTGTISSTTGFSSVGDGVHPGAASFSCQTTLPALAPNAVTILGCPAASNTAWSLQLPTAIPTTGHLLDTTVSGTNALLHDSGVVTANVVNASSPGAGIAHFAGSTQTVTSSAIVNADITSVAESKLTGSAAATTITEAGTGDAISRVGVETGNLTAPYVFTNGNSTNNNTSTGIVVGSTGTSSGAIGEIAFISSSSSGDIQRWYSGGSVSAGVYTPGTLEAHVTAAGGFNAQLFNAPAYYNSNTGNFFVSGTVPTIAGAGCGGSAAAMVAQNGSPAFVFSVGTAPGSACTITLPAAATGWVCSASDLTSATTSIFEQKQTGAVSTTSVTITNYNTAGTATSFVANDNIRTSCQAY